MGGGEGTALNTLAPTQPGLPERGNEGGIGNRNREDRNEGGDFEVRDGTWTLR